MKREVSFSGILKKRNNIEATENNEREHAKLILKLLPETQFGKVLDIGCGLGTCMKLLKPMSDKTVGLDIYPLGKKINPDLDIREYDLNSGKLPFDNNEFDLVIASGVLMHIFYPFSILKEIKRVLKPNKYAIISLFNAYNIANRLNILFGRKASEYKIDAYAIHYFTNINQNRNFIRTEFKILKEMNLPPHAGIFKFMSKVLMYPNLFSRTTFFLCKKS